MTTELQFVVNTEISVLSSECGIHKTEHFIKETRRFADIDRFLSKLGEGLIANLAKLDIPIDSPKNNIDCYLLQTSDKAHTFYIKFGCMTDSEIRLQPKDIVFFKYIDKDNSGRRNDQTFAAYMLANKTFTALLTADKHLTAKEEFSKLYNLSHSDGIHFPLLNGQQAEIVETEDKNILVQGVAGSGKTNICINKLIFTASRGYHGRTLYTTYSRGLLLDTRERADAFNKNLKEFVSDYKNGKVVFADKDRKRAIEIRFNMSFPAREEEKIIDKIQEISYYLDNMVDYYLIEDLYNKYAGKDAAADEGYFIKQYVAGIRNHQLTGKLNRIVYLSYEVVFKEIYGMILGCCDPANPQRMLSQEDYIARRKDSFTRPECEIIYSLAKDYAAHLAKSGLSDNNIMSRKLLQRADSLPKYSLAIIDEVQDMTEVSLCLMRAIAFKLFCVGDALQMINPSYFSFAYLKNLLFIKDVVSVRQLTYNYRNTKSIADIIDNLGYLNIGKFGTHSFVLKGESIDNTVETSTVYVKDKSFMADITKQNLDNFTIIVSTNKEKEELRRHIKRQEILTVSEIKGLERDTVILYNLLSANKDKWATLERTLLNRKSADENSVYRYYFNLFYVGVSRAKSHLYVVEDAVIPMFSAFFKDSFVQRSAADAIESLSAIVSRIEVEQEEMVERVRQFINLGQYDNARFAANKITDDIIRTRRLQDIDIFQDHISHGKYRDAGIRYWQLGRPDEAKRQFELSGDTTLCDLVDASLGGGGLLDIDIVKYYTEVSSNEGARRLILETIASDLKRMQDKQKELTKRLKSKGVSTNG